MARQKRKEVTFDIGRRSQWKGIISFGLINIPVQLFAAIRNANEIHFHLLDKIDHGRIGYRQINKSTGREVPRDRIIKGYEYEPDHFVVITDEDFDKANPKANRSIDLQGFVSLEDLDILFFQKPYYLLPDKNGERGYVLLRQALAKARKVAIGEIVLQRKQHLCALIPRGPYLVLELLYFSHELDHLKESQAPPRMTEVKINPRELEMAESLIQGMTHPWNPEEYRDSFFEDMMKLIETKARRGKVLQTQAQKATPTPTANVVDLMPLLKMSLQAAQGQPLRSERSKKTPRNKSASSGKRKKTS